MTLLNTCYTSNNGRISNVRFTEKQKIKYILLFRLFRFITPDVCKPHFKQQGILVWKYCSLSTKNFSAKETFSKCFKACPSMHFQSILECSNDMMQIKLNKTKIN
jgi:hypothetical protein